VRVRPKQDDLSLRLSVLCVERHSQPLGADRPIDLDVLDPPPDVGLESRAPPSQRPHQDVEDCRLAAQVTPRTDAVDARPRLPLEVERNLHQHPGLGRVHTAISVPVNAAGGPGVGLDRQRRVVGLV
jgi:hypothetical protein